MNAFIYTDKFSQELRQVDMHVREGIEQEAGNRRTVEVTAVGSVSLHHAGLHHHHPHICKNPAIDPDTGL